MRMEWGYLPSAMSQFIKLAKRISSGICNLCDENICWEERKALFSLINGQVERIRSILMQIGDLYGFDYEDKYDWRLK